jgi:DNA polymerase-3 subunit delta
MSTRPIKAEELSTAWSRKLFKSVYLFAGVEDFMIEEAVQTLSAQRLGQDALGASHDRLDAEDVNTEEILQTCQTMPFGGACRFVEVRNVHRLTAEQQRRLAEGLGNLPDSTQLVLIWGKEWRREDAHRPLVEATMGVGDVVIFWPLYPDAARRWLIQRAPRYGKTIQPDAAAWLIQEIGEGLRTLDQELAKISAFVGDRKIISPEDVQACSGYQKASSPFEWLTALRQRQAQLSMLTLRRLLDEGEEPLRLLAMATRSQGRTRTC